MQTGARQSALKDMFVQPRSGSQDCTRLLVSIIMAVTHSKTQSADCGIVISGT